MKVHPPPPPLSLSLLLSLCPRMMLKEAQQCFAVQHRVFICRTSKSNTVSGGKSCMCIFDTIRNFDTKSHLRYCFQEPFNYLRRFHATESKHYTDSTPADCYSSPSAHLFVAKSVCVDRPFSFQDLIYTEFFSQGDLVSAANVRRVSCVGMCAIGVGSLKSWQDLRLLLIESPRRRSCGRYPFCVLFQPGRGRYFTSVFVLRHPTSSRDVGICDHQKNRPLSILVYNV